MILREVTTVGVRLSTQTLSYNHLWREISPHQISLSLRDRNVGVERVCYLGGVLQGNTTLKELDLSANKLGPESVNALVHILNTTQITSINLADNTIGDEGVLVLAEALRGNTTLKHLDLSANNLGPAGAGAIAQMLNTTKLENIALEGNEIGSEGLHYLAEALKTNTRVQHIFVGSQGEELPQLEAELEMNRLLGDISNNRIIQFLPEEEINAPEDFFARLYYKMGVSSKIFPLTLYSYFIGRLDQAEPGCLGKQELINLSLACSTHKFPHGFAAAIAQERQSAEETKQEHTPVAQGRS